MILDKRCRQCRAKGEKLFLKGERCFSPKCSFLKRPHKPGMKSTARPKSISEYGKQLLEKQKAKLIYGINERQMRRYFKEASKKKGSTNELLFSRLEMRLDNIVFRSGLADARSLSRQMVSHGHFLVNGRKSKIPSREIRVGDVISIRPESSNKKIFGDLAGKLKKQEVPNFLEIDKDKFEIKVVSVPMMDDLKPNFNTSLIVEFYSK